LDIVKRGVDFRLLNPYSSVLTFLDPQARRDLWNLVLKIKKEGKTIILTTHYMQEAQYLCDDIAIMNYGKIIARGTPDALIKQYKPEMTIVLPRERFDLSPDDLNLP
jgi:ABC-2 type transport system ATP-binding protein